MARRRDQAKERYWRAHLAAWRQSGQSVRAYCADEGLSEPSFYAWRRASAEDDRAPGGNTVVGVSPFVPVRLVEDTPSPSAATVEVILRGGRVVRVGAGFAAQTLREVVAALEDLPC